MPLVNKTSSTKTYIVDQHKRKENKGMTVTPDALNESRVVHKDPSMGTIREELETVIEMMGPSTPHFPNISSDTDTEDLYSTSMYSSIVHFKTVKKSEYDDTENLISYCEDSDGMTARNIPEIEHDVSKNEVAVQTTDNIFPPPYSSFTVPQMMSYPMVLVPSIFQTDTRNVNSNTRRPLLSRYLGVNLNNKDEKYNLNELYKINIKEMNDDQTLPKRLIFDLIDGIPKSKTKTVGTNTKKRSFYPKPKSGFLYSNLNIDTEKEKTDIYYFDHGNSDYYRTTDAPPDIVTETIAERTAHYTTKFWAQIFGTVHIGVSFITSFILQFVRFSLHAILRPLTVGIIQLISDYFFKPLLAVLFNGIIQPPLIFFYNIATSIRDFLKPVADSFGYFIREIAVICKSIRLVHIEKPKSITETPNKKTET